MARRGLITWLSVGSVVVGLSAVVASFMGCYADARTQTGKCQGDDDGNPCTDTTCPEEPTKIVHAPAPDAEQRECSRGENPGICIAGNCKLDCEGNPETCKCAADTECPVSITCVKWSCQAKQCKRTDVNDPDTAVDTVKEHDCKKTVCISGAPQVVNDENDKVADMLGDCKKPTCVNMMPSTEALDTDEPQDEECTDWSCSNGEKTHKDADVGTDCSIGVCNSEGKCADCLTKSDWDACNIKKLPCPVKLCNREDCELTGDISCKSAHCADKVCCNEACTAACKSCNLTGTEGECTNVSYYQEDPISGLSMACDLASDGAVCDGNGNCLKIIGKACNAGSQCISNTCTSLKCVGAKGEACTSQDKCVNGACVMGACP